MTASLTVGQSITLEGNTYKVVGFDNYTLTNIYEKEKQWLSYTLVDAQEKRLWLGHGMSGDFFVKQWLTSEADFKEKTSKLPLNADYTGIANITFTGAQGYSVPVSEIVWFDSLDQEQDYLILERFLEQDGEKMKAMKSYYHLAKILKDFKV